MINIIRVEQYHPSIFALQWRSSGTTSKDFIWRRLVAQC